MISNLIPREVAHSSLDLFEKPPLLVTLKMHSPRKLDLLFLLMVLCSSLKYSATKIISSIFNLLVWDFELREPCLRTHATEAANRDTPYFVHNPLSSLFSECTLSLNGEKISTTNAHYAHKSFLRPSFHTVMMRRKRGWLAKVNIMKKTHQLSTVMKGELRIVN